MVAASGTSRAVREFPRKITIVYCQGAERVLTGLVRPAEARYDFDERPGKRVKRAV